MLCRLVFKMGKMTHYFCFSSPVNLKRGKVSKTGIDV